MNNSNQNLKSYGCLVIDDDPFIVDLLSDKLKQYFPELHLLGVGNNGEEGLQKIAKLKPDLVFLDVEMSDMTGFEMLSKLSDISFNTIFITSYRHYAIKAIRFNALDYLLKPFDIDELKNAIKRFKANIRSSNSIQNIRLAIKNSDLKESADKILSLRTQSGELHLPLKEIIYIEGDRNYSKIHLSTGTKKLVSKTLADLEDLLVDKAFFRNHKSFLVNRTHIAETAQNLGYIILMTGQKLPVSRRRRQSLKTWLDYHLL
ncbi:LytR/AlgR family response regulator transcription factor [Aegicerativicinus sediminis]